MIKPRRTKYQWVDSKWVQLFHELREALEKFVVYIYFRYVSRGDSSISGMPGCGPNALPKNWI